MFRNIIKKLAYPVRMGVSSAQYLLLGLVTIIILSAGYVVTTTEGRVSAGRPVFQTRTDAAEPVILQWMKEHSEMPDQVLSKIYSVAMNTVNADLVLAICVVESNFNPHVESEKGAIGLMGIMPDVWLEELKTNGIVSGQDDLYTISNNINSGIYVLGRYLARTNNLREALSRYAGGDPAYATRVLRRLGEISRARRSKDQARLAALRAKA